MHESVVLEKAGCGAVTCICLGLTDKAWGRGYGFVVVGSVAGVDVSGPLGNLLCTILSVTEEIETIGLKPLKSEVVTSIWDLDSSNLSSLDNDGEDAREIIF